MIAQFEAAFAKGTKAYGFKRTDLPPMAEYQAYSKLSDEDGDKLIKLIGPTGKVICLGMDSTVMAVLAAFATSKAGRICYINRVFSRKDDESTVYIPSKIKGGENLTAEAGIVQSHQWGMEIFGETSEMADAEVLAAAMTVLENAGLPKESLRLEIGDARLSQWLMAELGIVDQLTRTKVGQWLEEKNVQALMKSGYGPLAELASAFGDFHPSLENLKSKLLEVGLELPELTESLERLKNRLEGYGITDIQGDFGTTNRYHYYSSFIYRIYTKDSGKLIATGGRYDQMDGSTMKGCGLSFDSENITEVLEMNNLKRKSLWAASESDYTILWKENNDQQSVQLAESLRNMGYSVLVKYDSGEALPTNTNLSDIELTEIKKAASGCLVWVEGNNVKAIDCVREQLYQGDVTSFMKREEGRCYVGSIH